MCPTSFFITRFFVDMHPFSSSHTRHNGKMNPKRLRVSSSITSKGRNLHDAKRVIAVAMELSLTTPMPKGAPKKAGTCVQQAGKTVHIHPREPTQTHDTVHCTLYITYFHERGGKGGHCGKCSADVTPSSRCLLNSHPTQPADGQPAV